MLRFRNLGSGSTGNATVVEARSGTLATRLLVDCGLGLRQLEARLAQGGLGLAEIDAIFITHEHSDHIGCARNLALKHRIPVWMSHGTHAALGAPDFDGLLHFAGDLQTIEVGVLQFKPFTVPHDAREPLQLSCSDGAARLGVLTDLGHATAHLLAQLQGCGTVLLECNHDTELLEAGPYPPFLKRRVGGAHGHLANEAAAAIAQALLPGGLRQVVAAHLSEQNNRPELARAAMAAALGCGHDDIGVAHPTFGTEWWTV